MKLPPLSAAVRRTAFATTRPTGNLDALALQDGCQCTPCVAGKKTCACVECSVFPPRCTEYIDIRPC